jgi:iron complex outermembrane recepter protein
MKIRFLLFALLITNIAAAQQSVFNGKIVGKNNEPVAYATIHVLNTNAGANSDNDGSFTLSLRPGQYDLLISALGYAQRQTSIIVSETQNETVTINLTESVIQLDDVVVTAEKEETDLMKVPYSISALSAKKIAEFRMWNTRDITAIVPNVYSASPGDNRNVTSIRGITSSSYDPAVATYIDGVNQFSLDTYIAQLFDVERIEVLRGPQGTLYGRNAMGGVINIITRQPSNKEEIYAEISAGTFGQQRYALGFKTPLIVNKLFFGASGIYDRTDGFYTNTYDNSDFDHKKSFTGNYFLTYVVNPSWTVTLNAKHAANRNFGAFPLVMGVEEAFKNPFVLEQNAVTKLVDNVFNGSLKVNHAGSAINFTSLTTYQSNYRYYDKPIDGDFSSLDVVTISNNYGKDWNNVKVFTQEFKVSSPASTSGLLKWTAGAYFFRQDNPVKQATNFGAYGDLYGAQPFTAVINTGTGTSDGIAGYGQATYSLGKLDITAGIRYDYEKKEQSALGEYQPTADPEPVFVIRPDTSATTSYTAVSPKVGLSYHLSENAQVYGVYTRGYRTGGLTQISSDPSQGVLFEYDPEFSDNLEAGWKSSFYNNKLLLNVAAFYVTVKDVQVPTLILPEAVTITRNAGTLKSQGIEVELSATPIRGLQIDYNVGLTDAKYTTLNLPVTQEDFSVVMENKDGNRQIFTPKTTAMLALQYSYVDTDNVNAFIRFEWMTIGEQYFDLANSIQQDTYHLFNTRVGFAYDGLEVALWGRNIGDKRYISYAYDFGGIHLGDPATWGFTVSKRLTF